jgi:myo-inositol-1(or 4)-monophosphatase
MASLERRVAIDAARAAGQLLHREHPRTRQVSFKGTVTNLVTEMDGRAEALVVDALLTQFPDDGILAEESGEHHAVKGEEASVAKGRTWVVDPLDGTINYANGIPFFCVSIALLIDGRPQLGVVHDPVRGDTFSAISGGPARLGDLLIVASDKERLSDFVISLSLSGRSVAGRLRAVRKHVRVPRTMGSAALALAYVANGRFDAYVQQGGLSVWDVAAAGLIAERGGAVVTDMTGGPWFDVTRAPTSIGVLAAPPAHHEALLALVR